jgi:hypothetical protein
MHTQKANDRDLDEGVEERKFRRVWLQSLDVPQQRAVRLTLASWLLLGAMQWHNNRLDLSEDVLFHDVGEASEGFDNLLKWCDENMYRTDWEFLNGLLLELSQFDHVLDSCPFCAHGDSSEEGVLSLLMD